MAETHVELNQFPVPRVGPRHSTPAYADWGGQNFRGGGNYWHFWHHLTITMKGGATILRMRVQNNAASRESRKFSDLYPHF